jgi:hypothetical protein
MITLFETFTDNMDNIELFKMTYNENPLHTTHKLFFFIYDYEYRELDDGNYKKIIAPEKMVEINADKNGYHNGQGMLFRTKFVDKKFGVIWWPMGETYMIKNKGINNLDEYILNIIDKHKSNLENNDGKTVFYNLIKRINKINEFNI